MDCVPSEHQKKQEIETLIDELNRSAREMQQLQNQMVAEQENQRIFNQATMTHRTEIESLERVIQNQEKNYYLSLKSFHYLKQIYYYNFTNFRKVIACSFCKHTKYNPGKNEETFMVKFSLLYCTANSFVKTFFPFISKIETS